MSENIEQKCLDKGVKLTDQRRIIVKVLSESKKTYGESDHPERAPAHIPVIQLSEGSGNGCFISWKNHAPLLIAANAPACKQKLTMRSKCR